MKKTIAFASLCCFLCLFAAPAAVQAQGNPNYHASFLFLTQNNRAENPVTASFTFYNTFASDPSEYHILYILAAGSGFVNIIIGPATFVDVQYGLVGFFGLKPLYGVGFGAAGIPLFLSAPVAFFNGGVMIMASINSEPLWGQDYPAAMTIEAFFSDTPAGQE